VEEAHELAVLRGECVAGRIPLGEFVRRVRLLTGEADVGVDVDVDGGDGGDAWAASGSVTAARRAVAVLGSVRHRITGLVPRRVTAVALFGACHVDLGGACVIGDDLDVVAVPVFGTVKVVVPAGLEVDVTGVPVLGTVKDLGGALADDVLPGAPTVRVRCRPVFGTVKVHRSS
jgi:hypothetical protein